MATLVLDAIHRKIRLIEDFAAGAFIRVYRLQIANFLRTFSHVGIFIFNPAISSSKIEVSWAWATLFHTRFLLCSYLVPTRFLTAMAASKIAPQAFTSVFSQIRLTENFEPRKCSFVCHSYN